MLLKEEKRLFNGDLLKLSLSLSFVINMCQVWGCCTEATTTAMILLLPAAAITIVHEGVSHASAREHRGNLVTMALRGSTTMALRRINVIRLQASIMRAPHHASRVVVIACQADGVGRARLVWPPTPHESQHRRSCHHRRPHHHVGVAWIRGRKPSLRDHGMTWWPSAPLLLPLLVEPRSQPRSQRRSPEVALPHNALHF